MDFELSEEQEDLLDEAERILRREKLADFLNDFRRFFRRLRVGYYDERLIYILRWLMAQPEDDFEA